MCLLAHDPQGVCAVLSEVVRGLVLSAETHFGIPGICRSISLVLHLVSSSLDRLRELGLNHLGPSFFTP